MSTDARPIALWVVPVADLGGVARHVLDVFNLGMKDYRLVLFCPEGLLAERVRAMGGAVIAADFGPDFGYVKSLRSLDATIRALKPAIVHSHLAYADFIAAAVAARYPRVRLVSTEHGIAGDDSVYHGNQFNSFVKAKLHSVRLTRFNALAAVSEATKTAMEKKWSPRTPIQVIRNGVNRTNSMDPSGKDSTELASPRVLSLSRLAPEKRLDHLLRSFQIILQKEPNATLTVAGTGPLEAELKSLAESLGIKEKVSFPGFVDAQEAIENHDVLVQLSVWENCSYTLLDALAADIRVIATPVGGNPEIVPTEALVAAEDHHRIADLVVAHSENPSNGTHLPESWPTIQEMVSEIEELYKCNRKDVE
ncbi:glycosyltransferase [Neomicrococcus aestuarii]|uniref:Uncharacterized protein n=1 Tax=Neomicrococcus aestuarii TaxID=556325 RepID=A0A1L2ZM40_9MICC|nr:glycosyltransferase [Neomicrococcus aestuarii]APF40463.1 hypothetical protein BHE16_04880 [Neomicrococcus aestuarii]